MCMHVGPPHPTSRCGGGRACGRQAGRSPRQTAQDSGRRASRPARRRISAASLARHQPARRTRGHNYTWPYGPAHGTMFRPGPGTARPGGWWARASPVRPLGRAWASLSARHAGPARPDTTVGTRGPTMARLATGQYKAPLSPPALSIPNPNPHFTPSAVASLAHLAPERRKGAPLPLASNHHRASTSFSRLV